MARRLILDADVLIAHARRAGKRSGAGPGDSGEGVTLIRGPVLGLGVYFASESLAGSLPGDA
jgi:hypothetical protein